MLYLGIFRLEFEKTIAIFAINALEFVYVEGMVRNKNL